MKLAWQLGHCWQVGSELFLSEAMAFFQDTSLSTKYRWMNLVALVCVLAVADGLAYMFKIMGAVT